MRLRYTILYFILFFEELMIFGWWPALIAVGMMGAAIFDLDKKQPKKRRLSSKDVKI